MRKHLKTRSSESEKGQVLLVLILLLATTLTIILVTSLSSTISTQTTRLDEESQRALSVAEAGIDRALAENASDGTDTSANINDIDSQFSGSATIAQAGTRQTFVTPQLRKDEEYTFYLASYNSQTSTFSSPAFE